MFMTKLCDQAHGTFSSVGFTNLLYMHIIRVTYFQASLLTCSKVK